MGTDSEHGRLSGHIRKLGALYFLFFSSHIDLCVHNNKDSGNDYDNDSELERDNYALVLNNNNNGKGKGNGNSYGNDMTVNLKMLVTMT